MSPVSSIEDEDEDEFKSEINEKSYSKLDEKSAKDVKLPSLFPCYPISDKSADKDKSPEKAADKRASDLPVEKPVGKESAEPGDKSSDKSLKDEEKEIKPEADSEDINTEKNVVEKVNCSKSTTPENESNGEADNKQEDKETDNDKSDAPPTPATKEIKPDESKLQQQKSEEAEPLEKGKSSEEVKPTAKAVDEPVESSPAPVLGSEERRLALKKEREARVLAFKKDEQMMLDVIDKQVPSRISYDSTPRI